MRVAALQIKMTSMIIEKLSVNSSINLTATGEDSAADSFGTM